MSSYERSERSYDFAGVNQALMSKGAHGLIEALGVDYRRSGAFLFIQPPVADGKNSMWVKPLNGTWRNEVRDCGGDLIALIAFVRNVSQFEAYKWARGHLGYSSDAHERVSAAELARRDAEARQRVAAEQAQRDARSKKIFHWWMNLPKGDGTLCQTYLESRGIEVDRLGRFPHSIRYSGREEHVDSDGVVTYWPCMVALIMKGVEGIGVHKTWLRPDGATKAEVSPARKIMGQMSGGTIRLWHGRGDHAPSKAVAAGVKMPLIIGEGIETTLSAVMGQPAYRAEAALSLSNLLNLRWPDYASHLIWLRENDTKPAAMTMGQRVAAHFKAEAVRTGGIYKEVRSEIGSDINDWREV